MSMYIFLAKVPRQDDDKFVYVKEKVAREGDGYEEVHVIAKLGRL